MWSSSAPAPDVRVGIVTPAYNAAATLARTIASLQAQTLRAWRHVIVDDGSSDASLAIAEGFARRDPRITVLSQANGGPAAARNLGLAHIDAPWVYFLDADDWIAPTFLERALRIAARRQPAPDVVMLGYWSVDQHGRRIARHWPPEMSDPRAVLARSCPHAPVGIVASTAAVKKAGGFDPRFNSSEDWDLWSRVAASGARFAIDPAPRAFYSRLPGSLSRGTARLMAAAAPLIARAATAEPPEPNIDADAVADAVATFTLHTAAVALGAGDDPAPTLAAGPRLDAWSFDPATWAPRLLDALAYGRAADRAVVTADWSRLVDDLDRLAAALQARGADPRQLAALALHVEALARGPGAFDAPRAPRHGVAAAAVDVTALPPRPAGAAADHQVVALHAKGRLLSVVDIPCLDHTLTGDAVRAAAVTAAPAWPPRIAAPALGPGVWLDLAWRALGDLQSHAPGPLKAQMAVNLRLALAAGLSRSPGPRRRRPDYGAVLWRAGPTEDPAAATRQIAALERDGWRHLDVTAWRAAMSGATPIEGRPLLVCAAGDRHVARPRAPLGRLAPRAAQEALAALAATDGAPRVLALAPGDWTALVAALAARVGFALTLEAQHGFAQAGDDPMRTPRIRAGVLEAPETIVTRLRPSRL